MKKFLVWLICFNIISLPGYCVIDDEFVIKTLTQNNETRHIQQTNYYDEFVENTLDKNLPIKNVRYTNLQDGFAEENTNKNLYTKPVVDFAEQEVTVSKEVLKPKKEVLISDNNAIPVKIGIKKYLTTRQKIDDGDYVEFETKSEIKLGNKVYPAGTLVKARVELVSRNKIWGVPSDITLGNFTIDDKSLIGEIDKTGANRSLWLRPTVTLFTLFFGVGLLFIPVRGGHAKILPRQTYTLHYAN